MKKTEQFKSRAQFQKALKIKDVGYAQFQKDLQEGSLICKKCGSKDMVYHPPSGPHNYGFKCKECKTFSWASKAKKEMSDKQAKRNEKLMIAHKTLYHLDSYHLS